MQQCSCLSQKNCVADHLKILPAARAVTAALAATEKM